MLALPVWLLTGAVYALCNVWHAPIEVTSTVAIVGFMLGLLSMAAG